MVAQTINRPISLQKSRLLQERESVIEELNRLQEVLQGEVDLEPDEGDAEIIEHEKAAILLAMHELKIEEIDSALRSINIGRYGLCARCNVPIEPERLEAKPHAQYCIDCQAIVERAVHEAAARQSVSAEESESLVPFML